MSNLKLIQKTPFFEVYEDNFQGKPVRFIKNIATGQVSINTDDMAKCLGFNNTGEMMNSPKVQQVLSENNKRPEDIVTELKPEDFIAKN